MARILLVACWLTAGGMSLFGQAKDAVELTVADVVALVEAGFGDDVVVEKLRQNGKSFALSVDEMLQLKAAGASAAVLKAMMDPSAAVSAVSGGAGSPDQAEDWPANIPSELGVYVLAAGEHRLIEPEIVTWKVRGKLMGLATGGIKGGHVNGVLRGPSGRVEVKMPMEVHIVCEEGDSAHEYQLLVMRKKKDQREFRLSTTGLFSAGSSDVDLLDFTPERITSRLYRIQLTGLEAGEYGFLPPGSEGKSSGASVGRVYSFTVIR